MAWGKLHHPSGKDDTVRTSEKRKEYNRKWNRENRVWVIECRRKHQEKCRKFLDEYKRDRGCCYCQEREPCCLDFHHRDPTKKKFTITVMFRCCPYKLMKEIEKCILVCANCHRKLHKGFLIYRKVG